MVDEWSGAGQAPDGLNRTQSVHYHLTVSGFDGPWRVHSMQLQEGVGDLPACKVQAALSPHTLADETEILGKNVHLTIERDQEQRSFKGVCRQAKLHDDRDEQIVSLVIAPAAWMLSQGSDSRIYQALTVPELVDKVFAELLDPVDRSARSELTQTYEAHEYLVQHQESHFHFLSRLLDEEGIWFYFDHESEDHEVLVLCDSNDNRPRLSHPDGGRIHYSTLQNAGMDEVAYDLHRESRMGSTDAVVSGYDWTRPDLAVQSSRTGRADWQGPPMEDHDHDHALRYHRYDDGGGAYNTNTVDRRATHRAERLDLARTVWVVHTTATDARPGHVFELQGTDSDDDTYLILHVSGHGSQSEHGGTYGNTLRVIPASIPYRPPMPRRRLMPGPETATVVGPPGEEIYTDQHGRIIVQFHWDRRGGRNEHSTAWIRVVQSWAGEGWGTMFIPRIGMEVLVTFLGGDPNQPLVHGCLYNGSHPVPYALPQHKTRSTIKTNSSLGGNGYNELRFEDKKGQEEVWIHAEKDFNEVVENDHETTVFNCQMNTVKVDQTQTIERDQTETVLRDQSMTVLRKRHKIVRTEEETEIGPHPGNRTEKVHKDEKVEIGGERVHRVCDDDNLEVFGPGSRKVKVAVGDHLTEVETGTHETTCLGRFFVSQGRGTDSIGLESGGHWYSETGLTLEVAEWAAFLSMRNDGYIRLASNQTIAIQVGDTEIELTSSGVKITGPKIELDSSGDIEIKAAGQVHIKDS